MSENLEEKVTILEKKLEEANATIAALSDQMQHVLNYLRNPHLIEQEMRHILGRIQNLESNAVPQYSLFFEIGKMKSKVNMEVNRKLEKVNDKLEHLEEKQDELDKTIGEVVNDVGNITEKLDGMEKMIDVMELD